MFWENNNNKVEVKKRRRMKWSKGDRLWLALQRCSCSFKIYFAKGCWWVGGWCWWCHGKGWSLWNKYKKKPGESIIYLFIFGVNVFVKCPENLLVLFMVIYVVIIIVIITNLFMCDFSCHCFNSFVVYISFYLFIYSFFFILFSLSLLEIFFVWLFISLLYQNL